MSSFAFIYQPFRRWPFAVHALLALACVLLVGAVGYGLNKQAKNRWLASENTLKALQSEARLADARAAQAAAPSIDFTDGLPSRSTVDDVVRDIGRFAQSQALGLGALTIAHQTPTARELGRVQLTLSAVGEYAKTKAFMAELLARYPSLAVQSLTVRAGATDSAAQEWQWLLVLYTKD